MGRGALRGRYRLSSTRGSWRNLETSMVAQCWPFVPPTCANRIGLTDTAPHVARDGVLRGMVMDEESMSRCPQSQLRKLENVLICLVGFGGGCRNGCYSSGIRAMSNVPWRVSVHDLVEAFLVRFLYRLSTLVRVR